MDMNSDRSEAPFSRWVGVELVRQESGRSNR